MLRFGKAKVGKNKFCDPQKKWMLMLIIKVSQN